jgi:prephenate dehydratase
LRSGDCAAGVLPIDNTVNGPVMPTVDAVLAHEDISIVDDCVLAVSFDAFSVDIPDADPPTVVVSHPHALAQCRDYVRSLGLPTRAVGSTAAACENLAPGEIALAAPICGGLYPVRRVAAGVEDNALALTHFGLFRQGPPDAAAATATGDVFVLRPSRNVPGILHDVLAPLRDHDLNLFNIITRPVATSPGEYVFVLFLDGVLPQSTISELGAIWEGAHCDGRWLGPLTRRRIA